MSYTLVINNQNLVGAGNNTYQYNFLQGNFTIPEGTQMMVANVQIPYSFYNITAAYGNNTLTFNFPTRTSTYQSYNITIPDGFYTTTSLSNYLQQFFISNGFYLYNSSTAQNVYYLSLVYNSYQYGNQILASPIPTSLPAGYSYPSGYNATTIFGGLGFPSTSRTPYITIPALASTPTIGQFLGFGSASGPVNLPAQTGSGASITANITGNAVTSLTISLGGTNYVNPSVVFSGGGGSGAIASLVVSNGVITGYNIISQGSGYTSAPSVQVVANGGSYSGNSTSTPVGSTVNSIILRCSLVKNNVANPQDILDSFPITAGSAFGANINYSPPIPKWIKVSSGTFANFTITFCDQNLNLLAALDINILVTLLLSFPDAKK